jgi:AraC-like DNA-binding protein
MIPTHHTRTLFRSDLLRVLDYRCSGQDGPAPVDECSAEHAIDLPRSGVYFLRNSDGTVLADPNQVLFFNRGQAYQISHPLAGGDRSTIFVLRPDVLIEMVRAVSPAADERPERPFPASQATLDTRLRLVQYWLLTIAGRTEPDNLAVEERLLTLLGELLSEGLGRRQAGARRPTQMGNSHAELAERVKLILAERCRESLQLDEIARAVHTSPFHLLRVFKQQTGLPIHRYLGRLRLHLALEDLAERPQEPLSRIALDLGYASHNHFTAAFHREFNLTPSEFRQTASTRQFHELSNFLKA